MPRNITIIGASAGSGKTYRLCDKYFACLNDGESEVGVTHALPRQVLATTFTRKAAAELVQRLRNRLLSKGRTQAALCVEDGYIGTVHGVCLSLLKDFALERGYSPDMAPLPEEDEERIFSQATATVMDKYGRQLYALAHRLHMDAYLPYGGPRGLEDWDRTVRNLCKMARANGLGAPQLLEQGAENACAYLAILPQALSDNEAAVVCQKLDEAVRQALSGMESNGDCTKKTAAVKELLAAWTQGKERIWQDWQELLDAEPAKKSDRLYKPVQELAACYPCLPTFQQDMTAYIENIFSCAAECLNAYAAWKKTYGLLDYNDMEALALELLQDPEAAAALQGHIQQVFVDEFQDTSPLQLALFLRLADIAKASIWVGDIKQAIYGFRGTDPVLMQTVVQRIGHDPGNDLHYSWRSRPCLVEFTNAFFSAAFAVQGIAADSVRLLIPDKRKNDPCTITGLRYWQDEGKADAKNLALRVASVLLGRTDQSYQLWDRESGILRPLEPRDMAILCRSNTECTRVADALKACGVAADVSLYGLMREPEIVLCLAAYRCCVDKRDVVASLILLRLLQPDMEEWLDKALEGGMKGIEDLVNATSLGSVLEQLRPQMVTLSPSEAVRYLASLLDSIRCVARWGDYEQRLANLDMLYALALQYEEACCVHHESCTHAGCIAWLMDAGEQPEAPASGRNAVRVLTYHKAKGLEWPVVILCSLGNKSREHACFGLQMMPPSASMDLDNPLAERKVHYWPWPCGGKKSLCATVKAKVDAHPDKAAFDKQSLQEELRLLYVGMTRARDILIFHVGQKMGAVWLESVLPINGDWELPSAEKREFRIGGEKFPVRWETCSEILETEDDVPEVAPVFPVPPQGARPTYAQRVITPNGLPQVPSLAVAYALEPLHGKLTWHGKEDPLRIGNAVHAWLCVDMPTMFSAIPGQGKREERQAWFAQTWKLSPEDGGQLVGMSDRLHQTLAALAEKAHCGAVRAYHVEWPVYQQRGTQILAGRMDLLVECERGIILVDHKHELAAATAKLYKETMREYSGQMHAYLNVLRAAGYTNVLACLHLPAQGVLLRYVSAQDSE
ncbi:MAG: UvrD-helicase domain-containing protein [Desulfovibrio sp.]|nr:UvrD-helicase domain-containing protein [Desulfovibrio sp.]